MKRRHLIAVFVTGAVSVGLVSATSTSALGSADATATVTAPDLDSAPVAAAGAVAEVTSAQARTHVRIASFNVRTARAKGDKRSWLKRAPDVAREILSRKPGVVALQELGPGRADGKKTKINGAQRQTTSLTSQLARQGGARYKLVRTTPYVAPGTKNGTQGARILYDSSRYKLMSWCPEKTGKKKYNRSCSMTLPVAAGDSNKRRRQAAYARFKDRRTGQGFYVASAHLDQRHSNHKKFNALRARQAAYVAKVVARANTRHLPVVFGGDINSWRTISGGDAPRNTLRARGYRDTVGAATTRVHLAYPTINHFRTTIKASKSGHGPQLDVLMVRKMRSASLFENKMKRVDRARPSDHNMVLADIVL